MTCFCRFSPPLNRLFELFRCLGVIGEIEPELELGVGVPGFGEPDKLIAAFCPTPATDQEEQRDPQAESGHEIPYFMSAPGVCRNGSPWVPVEA